MYNRSALAMTELINVENAKITTHKVSRTQFAAKINGIPLIGPKGSVSRFYSRNDAREAAESRLAHKQPTAVIPVTAK
jgi:hypothetical protein